jgi:alkylation response protein AidB-like acyl-CoA dehydrogenase
MSTPDTEDLETFRARARAFIGANLGPIDAHLSIGPLRNERTDEEELAAVARERQVQRLLFDADLAGVCFPKEYGGQGLTPAHQRVLNEELVGYEYPARIQAPTFSPCAAVLLDLGTEEQKRQHLPAILRGEEIWMQFLSEPSGGSDVAGALTSAVRDGDEWVLNGSKIWTTGAWWACAWPGPTGTYPSTGASPCSSCPSASRAWTSTGSRCSTARRSSAKSS